VIATAALLGAGPLRVSESDLATELLLVLAAYVLGLPIHLRLASDRTAMRRAWAARYWVIPLGGLAADAWLTVLWVLGRWRVLPAWATVSPALLARVLIAGGMLWAVFGLPQLLAARPGPTLEEVAARLRVPLRLPGTRPDRARPSA
jgi:hypothetical protein